MKLDRNINPDGWGKYALVLMRVLIPIMQKPATDAEAVAVREAFELLIQKGIIRTGAEAPGLNFFVLGFNDRFTPQALRGYYAAVKNHAEELPPGQERAELLEFAEEIRREFVTAVITANKTPN